MKPVRLYISLFNQGGWSHSYYRDIATMRDYWNNYAIEDEWQESVIHVGYERPNLEFSEFHELPHLGGRPVYLTESARWSLPILHARCTNTALSFCEISGRDEKCGLHLSIEGWGYALTSDTIIELEISTKLSTFNPSDWVELACDKIPDLCDCLISSGIESELTYQKFKHKLDRQALHKLSQFRYELLKEGVDFSSPFDILGVAPEWLLSSSIISIRPTVRISNAFEREGIINVKDLLEQSEANLLRWKNFGRKSLKDLSKILKAAIERPPLRTGKLEVVSLFDHLDASLKELPEKPEEILRARLGSSGRAPLTLQKIGELFGVTRERIRQIEKKFLDKIIQEQDWDDLLIKKIFMLRKDRKEPLYLDLLAAEDEWFRGFKGNDLYLKEVICRFSEGKVKAFELDGRWVLSAIDKDTFTQIGKRLDQQIKDLLRDEPSKDEVEALVETACIGYGVPELFKIALEIVDGRLHYAASNGKQVLVSIGKGVDHFVSAVLRNAEKPLHYTEIHQRVAEMYDLDVDPRRVQGSLVANPDALIYGRGVYGTTEHFDVIDDDVAVIVEMVEEALAEGVPYRQWHSAEIYDILIEQDAPSANLLNIYTIDIVLGKSDRFTYLSKHIWTSSEYSHNADRIQVRDIVVSVIDKARGPLTMKEIKLRVTEHRGLTGTLQITPDETLVRVSSALWGLTPRDLPLEKEEILDSVNSLHDYLAITNKSAHVSEIDEIVGNISSDISISYTVMSFCQCDERFKTWPGHLIGLSAWKEPKRHNIRSAFAEVISRIDRPVHLNDIHDELVLLLGRDIGKDVVSNKLSQSSIIYNASQGTWEPFQLEY